MSTIEEITLSYTDEDIECVADAIQCEGGNMTARQVKNIAKAISSYPFVEDKYKMILLDYISRMKDATSEAKALSKDKTKYYSFDKIDYVVQRGLSSIYDEVEKVRNVYTDDTLERRLNYLSEEIVVDAMLLDAKNKSLNFTPNN